ncbi:unnamed protein product [Owenia fusiformis]|uniref:Glycosyltransferase family 92 protein n=1 Tax=Owenia fusiformis TaxID=6347 RepID=A0A8S4PB75_OWEFU|nr:unnamed protein product [Owenia fusiformis]
MILFKMRKMRKLILISTFVFLTTGALWFKASPTSTFCTQHNNNWKVLLSEALPDGTHELVAYSAYYDNRTAGKQHIRIISATNFTDDDRLYCELLYEDGQTIASTVEIVTLNQQSNVKYPAVFVLCEIPMKIKEEQNKASLPIYEQQRALGKPCAVSFSIHHSKENEEGKLKDYIPVQYQSNGHGAKIKMRNFAVCLPPYSIDNISPEHLVEYLELYQLLGVQDFYAYSNSETIPKETKQVVDFYINKGRLTVLPWKPFSDTQDTNYEMAAINDCLYRTMFRYHYVIFTGPMDFIIPHVKDNKNLGALMEHLDRTTVRPGSFAIRRAVFHTKPENHINLDTIEQYTEKINISEKQTFLDQTRKCITMMNVRRLQFQARRKGTSVISIPERVIEMGSVFAWKHVTGYWGVDVPGEEAIVHSYIPCQGICEDNQKLVYNDVTIHKWIYKLWRNVNTVLKQMSTIS